MQKKILAIAFTAHCANLMRSAVLRPVPRRPHAWPDPVLDTRRPANLPERFTHARLDRVFASQIHRALVCVLCRSQLSKYIFKASCHINQLFRLHINLKSGRHPCAPTINEGRPCRPASTASSVPASHRVMILRKRGHGPGW